MTGLDGLAEARYVLLTTFRRDGTPVPTPVSHAVADGVVYTSTGADTGKVKRLRRNPRVTVAACDIRGRTTGPAIDATGRVLTGPDADRAVRLKDARNRLAWARRMYEVHVRGNTFVGIEIHLTVAPPTDVSGSEQP